MRRLSLILVSVFVLYDISTIDNPSDFMHGYSIVNFERCNAELGRFVDGCWTESILPQQREFKTRAAADNFVYRLRSVDWPFRVKNIRVYDSECKGVK